MTLYGLSEIGRAVFLPAELFGANLSCPAGAARTRRVINYPILIRLVFDKRAVTGRKDGIGFFEDGFEFFAP